MGRTNQAIKDYRMRQQLRQQIEEVMNSPQYLKAREIDRQQAALQALFRFCFLTCEYLELKHGYKKNGLENFLKFAKLRVIEIGNEEEDDAFEADNKYYIDNYNLDVLGAFGLDALKGEDHEN